MVRLLRDTKALISCILGLTLVVTALYYPWPAARIFESAGRDSEAVTASSQPKLSHWPGWSGIKHMVVFGDSITSTKFSVRGEQPSETNPLGNPNFPGSSSAIGPNWVGFLTATYNATFLKTINLATGGATIDGDIISGMNPLVKSFKDQIAKWWIPYYTPPPLHFNWRANDTLFVPFLGTNDVGRAVITSTTSAMGADVDQYAAQLEVLYQSGARNFLVLQALPLERAPFVERFDEHDKRELTEIVKAYNDNLSRVVTKFMDMYPDTTVFLFNMHALYNQLMDEPCSYVETCPLQITSTYCRQYMHEEENPYKFDPECKVGIDKYFWLNTLHPSFRVHNATAKAIAAYLSDAS